MKPLSLGEIDRYIRHRPMARGKAGGYGIQDETADPFVTCMKGSHSQHRRIANGKNERMLTAVGVMPHS